MQGEKNGFLEKKPTVLVACPRKSLRYCSPPIQHGLERRMRSKLCYHWAYNVKTSKLDIGWMRLIFSGNSGTTSPFYTNHHDIVPTDFM